MGPGHPRALPARDQTVIRLPPVPEMRQPAHTRASSHDWASGVDRDLTRSAVARELFGTRAAPTMLGEYRVLRRIGAGGMGLVFEAHHGHSGQPVAIKVLRDVTPDAVQRLKREFRALSALHHRNLVQLHELCLDADAPFIAMELVRGCALEDFVAAAPALRAQHVRLIAKQLVDAVSALHAARVLHRDLKPSNLLIEPDGRLVVLDFGLARALGEPRDDRSNARSGTLAYMAPERWLSADCDEASDWYSVGLIVSELLGEARSSEPPDPQIDPELSQLCARMLHVDAPARPSGPELRRFFALTQAGAQCAPLRPNTDAVFVGREQELSALFDAFAQVHAGAGAVVQLCGEPGVGKTALIRHFTSQLQREHDVIVLGSRCYERELIPYNALDGIVDGLARELGRSSELRAFAASMDAAPDLERLFPVLHETRDAAWAPPPHAVLNGQTELLQEIRERALAALRTLLSALSARSPLIIHLDDLQWGDQDSAHALAALLEHGPLPRVLLIACYRDEASPSPSLRALQDAPGVTRDALRFSLGPLSEADALQLAGSLAEPAVAGPELGTVVREAAGSPLFLRLLIRHRTQLGVAESEQIGSVQQLLQRAMEQLPIQSQRLLQLSALGARPLPRELLLGAAALAEPHVYWSEHATLLQRVGWLRSVPAEPEEALECYHDRVRESVLAAIGPQLKLNCHGWLAQAAAATSAQPDAEFLALQYEGAGELALAAHHAEQAGDRAWRAVAIEHAVDLYSRALRCSGAHRPATLVRKLADAMAHTGRCAPAVSLYLEAAEATAQHELALQLRLRAGEMLLRSALNEDGARIFEPVLRSVGLRFPRSKHGAMASAFASGLWLQLRGVGLPKRRRAPNERDWQRAEVCFRLGYRLTVADPLRSGSLLLRSLLLAQRSGDEAQFARALACYVAMLTSVGQGSRAQQDRLIETAWQLACQLDRPDIRVWVLIFHAWMRCARMELQPALELIQQACDLIVAHAMEDTAWWLLELDMSSCSLLAVLQNLPELERRSSLAQRAVKRTGTAFQAALLTCSRVPVWLARDEPARAFAELEAVLRSWPPGGSHQVIAAAIYGQITVLVYTGKHAAAWRLMREYAGRDDSSGYNRIRPWRTLRALADGQVALACVRNDRDRYARFVRQRIAILRKDDTHAAAVGADLLEAGLMTLRGERERAAQRYRQVIASAERGGAIDAGMCARMRLSELVDPSQGQPLRNAAEQWFKSQGVVDISKWIRINTPV